MTARLKVGVRFVSIENYLNRHTHTHTHTHHIHTSSPPSPNSPPWFWLGAPCDQPVVVVAVILASAEAADRQTRTTKGHECSLSVTLDIMQLSRSHHERVAKETLVALALAPAAPSWMRVEQQTSSQYIAKKSSHISAQIQNHRDNTFWACYHQISRYVHSITHWSHFVSNLFANSPSDSSSILHPLCDYNTHYPIKIFTRLSSQMHRLTKFLLMH